MKKFLALISSFSGLVFFVLACCNFALAYKAMRVVNTHVVTNYVEHVTVVTNLFDGAFVSTNVPPSGFTPPFSPSSVPVDEAKPVPRKVAQYRYQYFLVGRRIGAEMFGRYYYDGSPCSFGRIREIYPDRIILESGDWIENRNLDVSQVAKNERNDRNDR